MAKAKTVKRKQILARQLKKKLKKRSRRPKPKPTAADLLVRVSAKMMKRVSRDHEDLLREIESALVYHYQVYEGIDDALVARALKAAILGRVPSHACADRLVTALRQVRRRFADTSDGTWQDSLRVVLTSVHNHSRLQPGETGYLDFVEFYLLSGGY